MPEDSIWRNHVNSIKIDLEGDDPPEMETIEVTQPKKKGRKPVKKYQVQKLETVIYVYTDIEGQSFQAVAYQNMTLLGEMSGNKLEKMINSERHGHTEEEG